MKYRSRVIREARYFMGLDAPWHYFMEQIAGESNWREDITAFDGGKGLSQFMDPTAAELHRNSKALQEISPSGPAPYNPAWAIRALIIYDRWLYRESPGEGQDRWYYTFRAYNGGLGAIRQEIKRAGSIDKSAVERECRRRVIRLKNGSLLDLCKVNIEYPYKIFRNAQRWKVP